MPLLPVWDEPEDGEGGDVVAVLMTIRSVLGTLSARTAKEEVSPKGSGERHPR
jgi:hypothetical protein